MTTRATDKDLQHLFLKALREAPNFARGAARGVGDTTAAGFDAAYRDPGYPEIPGYYPDPRGPFTQNLDTNLPVPEDPGAAYNIGRGVGADLPFIVAAAPIGAPAGLMGIAAELGLGTLGSFGGRVAGEMGAGGGTQWLADVATSMTPGMAAKGAMTSLAAAPLAVAKKVKGAYTDIVPDIRHFQSHVDALPAVKPEPHLIQKKPGKDYVGAPRGVNSKQKLNAMRKKYDKLAEEGHRAGAAWYDRIRSTTSRVAPGRETQFANEWSMMSPQATPEINLGFSLQGANAYEAGVPRDLVRTRGQAEQLRVHRETGNPDLSRKTVQFARASDPTQNPTVGGTHDLWDARAFGYPKDTLTENNHRFMDYEVVLATERANKKGLGGRSDWTSDEIQASVWSAVGGRDRLKRFDGDLDAAIESMASTDFFPKHAAYGTYEAIPSASGGHLQELADMPYPIREEYSLDPRSSWIDPNTGEDILTRSSGLYQLEPQTSLGQFVNPTTGQIEFNPGFNTRPLIAFDKVPKLDKAGNPILDKDGVPKKGRSKIADHDRSILNKVETVRGYVDAQEGSAWNKSIPVGKQGVDPKDANAIGIATGRLDEDQLRKLTKITDDLGYNNENAFAIRNYDNTLLMDFGTEDKLRPKKLSKDVKSLKKLLSEAGIPFEDVDRRFADTGYIDFSEGRESFGTGRATGVLFDQLDDAASPATAGKLDSPELRQAALDRLKRDEEYSAKLGIDIREDVQNARRIISTEGLEGLRAALKRGEVLPSIALPILAGGTGGVVQSGREE